uniref:Transthyretin-like family-containing protein n=1 Tax=Strongyloides venezuelensis TaxID=75913 RepID=A0A0K0FWH5_STRVS
MIGFYKLFISLIILIYETNGKWPPSNLFITAIMGEVKCKYENEKKIVVTLYTMDRRKKKEIVLSSRYAEYGRPFLISGTYRSFTRPDFYLKIYHSCHKYSRIPYIERFDMKIDKYYVNRFQTKPHFLTLDDIELSKLKGQKISYGFYKKQTKF